MFGRRSKTSGETADVAPEGAAAAEDEATEDIAEAPAPVGPFDIDDLPDDGIARVDLGSMLMPPVAGKELRMQVDEKSGNVAAVALAGDNGALELRAFAAPRNGDLWSEVLPSITEDMLKRGGTAEERQGTFGTELVCQRKVQMADGKTGLQASRIVGINGPRWMLRATFLGQPALSEEAAEEWEAALRLVAVRRGDGPMAAGAPLPVELPENAKRVGEVRRGQPEPLDDGSGSEPADDAGESDS